MAYADYITITSIHTSMSAAKTYILPYLHTFLPGQRKQSHSKSRQNNLYPVHSRPCGIYAQSEPQNKQHCTTHDNPPKGFGSYLRPKTHIQQTHSQHLSTRTQASTTNKNTQQDGVNRRRHSWLSTRQS